MERRRLLVLTDKPFWRPVRGSDERIASLVAYVAEHWDVAVHHPGRLDDHDAEILAVRFPAVRVYDVAGPVRRRSRAARPRPGWRLEDVMIRERPLVLLVEYFWLTRHLQQCSAGRFDRTLTVLDTLDVMHRRTRMFARLGLEAENVMDEHEERFYLDHYDLVLAIQQEEARVLRRLSERPVLVVPHGRPVVPVPRVGDRRSLRLGLVSSAGPLQRLSLRHFLGEHWGALRQAMPDIELHVFGTLCEDFAGDPVPPGVAMRGFAPDLAAAFAEIDVAINPVLGATGLAIKSVDAVCHGRPLFSTSAGVAGFPSAPYGGVTVCENTNDWLRLRELVGDPARLVRLSADALAYARAHFSREAAFDPLLAHLEEAARTMPVRRPVDLGVRTEAVLRRWPDLPARSPRTRRVVVMGVGPLAGLVGACLPNDAVVVHVDRMGGLAVRAWQGRPVMPLSDVALSRADLVVVADGGPTPTGPGVVDASAVVGRLVVFGTGAAAQALVAAAGGTAGIVAFADNDPARQGTTWLGRPVLAPRDLAGLDFDRVVIASMHQQAIRQSLADCGLGHVTTCAFQPSRQEADDAWPQAGHALEMAAYYFRFPSETADRLLSLCLASRDVVVPAVAPSTAAAAVLARAMGCAVAVGTDGADPSSLLRLGITPLDQRVGPAPDLAVLGDAGARNWRAACVVRLDARGRLQWVEGEPTHGGSSDGRG